MSSFKVRILLVLDFLDCTIGTAENLFEIGNEFTARGIYAEVNIALVSASRVDSVNAVVDPWINLWDFESVRYTMVTQFILDKGVVGDSGLGDPPLACAVSVDPDLVEGGGRPIVEGFDGIWGTAFI
jgi:hypothetical protein